MAPPGDQLSRRVAPPGDQLKRPRQRRSAPCMPPPDEIFCMFESCWMASVCTSCAPRAVMRASSARCSGTSAARRYGCWRNRRTWSTTSVSRLRQSHARYGCFPLWLLPVTAASVVVKGQGGGGGGAICYEPHQYATDPATARSGTVYKVQMHYKNALVKS